MVADRCRCLAGELLSAQRGFASKSQAPLKPRGASRARPPPSLVVAAADAKGVAPQQGIDQRRMEPAAKKQRVDGAGPRVEGQQVARPQGRKKKPMSPEMQVGRRSNICCCTAKLSLHVAIVGHFAIVVYLWQASTASWHELACRLRCGFAGAHGNPDGGQAERRGRRLGRL